MVYTTSIFIIIFSMRVWVYSYSNPMIVTVPQISKMEYNIENYKCDIMQGGIPLNFRNVGLRRINSDFTNNSNVNCLNLADNEIDFVSPSAFRLIPNLQSLNLTNNKISISNISELNSHSQLRTLILDENNSSTTADAAIFNLKNKFPRLLYLHLRGNGIEDVSTLTFAPNLMYLYLSSNNLSNSELSFLNDAPNTLIGLDLAYNGIRNFDASKLSQLQELHLDGNEIERLCDNSGCDSALVIGAATELRRLSLSKNRLKNIESNVFDNTNKLTELDLSYNLINTIEKNAFGSVYQLRTLSFKENLLSEIPDIHGLEFLEYISLSANKIEIIKNGLFSRNRRLKIIDLSNNKIKIVEANAFDQQSLLEILDLSNNRLTSFPPMWLTQLIKLKVLYVNGNQFKNLMDLQLSTIRNFAHLEHIYLQNNFITTFHTSSLYSSLRVLPNITLELFDVANQSQSLREVLPSSDECNCNCDVDIDNDNLADLL